MSEIVNCNQCEIGRVKDERCTRCGAEQPAEPVVEESAPEPVKKAKK